MEQQSVVTLSLTNALNEWADMQAVIGKSVILVRDFACYEGGGIIVKVDDEEPEGIDNPYYSIDEIERDLARVVPGYIKGSAVWLEHQEEERW